VDRLTHAMRIPSMTHAMRVLALTHAIRIPSMTYAMRVLALTHAMRVVAMRSLGSIAPRACEGPPARNEFVRVDASM
jgi:hypothetical protein